MDITFHQVKLQTMSTTLDIKQWHILPNQSWGVFSTKGDIGSVLSNLFCQQSTPQSGTIAGLTEQIAQVSLTEQQRLLEIEIANDDTDFMDCIDTGSTVYSLIQRESDDDLFIQSLIRDLDLVHLQNTGFRVLSTGETRRLMLAIALAKRPKLLILDEVYSGLDIEHRQSLTSYLSHISKTTQLIIIVSREEEMPSWVDKIALFDDGALIETMDKHGWDNHPIIEQLTAQCNTQTNAITALMQKYQHTYKFENPLFQLSDGKVEYTDKTIFSNVNWRIDNGQHWQISGPNGCGKSTLLGLICGDHPQCYSNNITIFGKKRGSGETIWDIKKNIGIVSSALHLQYRVNCSALHVVLSGFYDSIGLYNQPSKKEVVIAKEWLAIMHMDSLMNVPFKQLEYGQQRLLLIVRALVKRPTLLILDEPYQGLDYLGRRLIMNTLEMVAKENLSQLLYVSHYQEDALPSITNFVNFTLKGSHSGYEVNVIQNNKS